MKSPVKKSIKKETHHGNQPIRVLKHNLTSRLLERNGNYINTLQSDFKLNKQINYHIENLALSDNQLPYIDKYGTINIHETFLSYNWIICYYFFVLHEEALFIPDSIKRNTPNHKSQNLELLKDAEKLFDYAKLLIKYYEPWDLDNHPNPEYFNEDSEEGFYILRTNDLYVEVINFILYHEIAHAEFEHIRKKNIHNLTNEEIKLLEIDADTRAIELILINSKNKSIAELAIITGLASMLFFKNDLAGGEKHPNWDKRIENAISKFEDNEGSSIWTILVLFLKVWDKQFNLKLNEKPSYESYKELFYDLFSQIK